MCYNGGDHFYSSGECFCKPKLAGEQCEKGKNLDVL